MDQFTHRLVIEPAENGFLVYVNQDFSQGTVRPRPYVFESMESLLNFVADRFSEKQSINEIRKTFNTDL